MSASGGRGAFFYLLHPDEPCIASLLRLCTSLYTAGLLEVLLSHRYPPYLVYLRPGHSGPGMLTVTQAISYVAICCVLEASKLQYEGSFNSMNTLKTVNFMLKSRPPERDMVKILIYAMYRWEDILWWIFATRDKGIKVVGQEGIVSLS